MSFPKDTPEEHRDGVGTMCEERDLRDDLHLRCRQVSNPLLAKLSRLPEIASLECARNDIGAEKTFLDIYITAQGW